MLVVCASLFRQYEFVQQQWLNYGLDSNAGNDTCPIVGNHFDGTGKEPKAKFVVSPNTPVRQIWVSAHSRSFKLDWSPDKEVFVLPDTGQTLDELISSAIAQQTGEEVTL